MALNCRESPDVVHTFASCLLNQPAANMLLLTPAGILRNAALGQTTLAGVFKCEGSNVTNCGTNKGVQAPEGGWGPPFIDYLVCMPSCMVHIWQN